MAVKKNAKVGIKMGNKCTCDKNSDINTFRNTEEVVILK